MPQPPAPLNFGILNASRGDHKGTGHLNVHQQNRRNRSHSLGSIRVDLEGNMIQLKVNGVAQSFDGDPQMPLLWYLRDILGLTGTKFGCGIALCGACTVHKNGEALRACITPMSSLAGAEIRTIEDISANGLHPVQKMWMQFNVPQCGYCQSGQIMQAIALLKDKPKPTDQDIDDGMAANICRCGTYQRIRAAIKAAAEESA
ncbi:MAG: isoquinoline 1-oxidoreductase subunit alpha [Acidobacteriaceae bacterium]|jgi:isoquinoline 1-oxidoreductase alpha subunit|nr:isoquinoline 1-oxidoreductase subunit alpha [Acidobacteriaceae bacterium]